MIYRRTSHPKHPHGTPRRRPRWCRLIDQQGRGPRALYRYVSPRYRLKVQRLQRSRVRSRWQARRYPMLLAHRVRRRHHNRAHWGERRKLAKAA